MTGHVSRRALLRSGAVTAGLGIFAEGVAASQSPGDDGRYIVGTGNTLGTRRAVEAADAVTRVIELGTIGQAVSGRFSPDALRSLERRPNVRYVEPDGRVQALGETLPWGIDRVDADVVHNDGDSGNGADIAILDTGIDSDHPDLQKNLGEGYAVETCDGRYVNCRHDWDDDNDHGTHCAGIADAVDNSKGVRGVSTSATLHSVKVLDRYGSGYWSGIAEGIQWVADRGYDVASMSFGATSASSTVRDACQYAHDKGVCLVAAAGNEGECTDCVVYPAKYSMVIAVSATNEEDGVAYYSSTGPEVEVAAPGSNIYSTTIGDYGTKSGTSMACPHVTGGAGQLMANGRSNTETRNRLQETAEDVGLSSNEQGSGLLDVEAALGDTSSDTAVVVSTGSASGVGTSSATLDGSLDDLGGASSANVAFEYRETGASTWQSTPGQTMSTSGAYSEDVSGLSSGSEYEFRAVANASDGDSDTGTTSSFTTSTSDTSVVVSTGSATNIGTDVATLNGTLDDLGGASSADVYFEYRESGTSSWTSSAATTLSATGSFSDEISGLSSGTDYEYRAVADAADGDSDTGATASFTTSTSDTSVAVSTDGADTVGTDSAALNGTLNDLGGASSSDVYFEYGKSGNALDSVTSTTTLSSTGGFEIGVSGLSSGTEYDFRAIASASDGDTDTGTISTFTTDSTSNTAPTIDAYSVTEAGSPNPHADITADWDVGDRDGNLNSVVVEVFDASGSLVASDATHVSGSNASGSSEFKIKHADNQQFDVSLTVTDATGNTATDTRSVSS